MKNLPDCITDMIYDHLDDKDHLSIACTSWGNYWYLWDIVGSWTWNDNFDDNYDNYEYFGDDFVIKKPYPKGPKCRYCKNYKYSNDDCCICLSNAMYQMGLDYDRETKESILEY